MAGDWRNGVLYLWPVIQSERSLREDFRDSDIATKVRVRGDHSSLLINIAGLEAYGKPKGLFAQSLRCVIDNDIGDFKVVIGKLRGYTALDAADSTAGRIDQHHLVIIVGDFLARGVTKARLGVDVELKCPPIVQRGGAVIKAIGTGAFSNTEAVSENVVDKVRGSEIRLGRLAID